MIQDIFEKIKQNRGPIGQHAKESHGYFTFPKLEGPIGPHMNFRGKQRLNWSLNNYLGLADHPEVRKADAESAAEYALESLISEEGMKDYVGKNPEKFNEPTRDLYARNTARFGGDDGQPGAKGERKSTGTTVDRSGKSVTGFATGVSKPEGVPRAGKTPITPFGGGGVGGIIEPGKKRSLYFDENKQSVKESATGGASSAGSIATTVGGAAHKPTSGVPKKLGNAHKAKKIAVGKGVYDK